MKTTDHKTINPVVENLLSENSDSFTNVNYGFTRVTSEGIQWSSQAYLDHKSGLRLELKVFFNSLTVRVYRDIKEGPLVSLDTKINNPMMVNYLIRELLKNAIIAVEDGYIND